jgi:hypothetical protein
MSPAGTEIDRLAAEPLDDADAELFKALARVTDRVDPMPPGLVERIGFALSLAELEAEVARLQELDLTASGVRSEAGEQARTVTFTSQSLTTMITVEPIGDDRVRIDGWLAPAGPARVELRRGADSRQVEADDDGRFVFADVPSGPVQLVVHRPGVAPVITPTTRL